MMLCFRWVFNGILSLSEVQIRTQILSWRHCAALKFQTACLNFKFLRKFGCFFLNLQNQSFQQNKCCNSSTCQLASPAGQCALGSCCDLSNCTFHQPNKVCRASQDVCDIQETCDGVTAFCPTDDHYVNGELCALNR